MNVISIFTCVKMNEGSEKVNGTFLKSSYFHVHKIKHEIGNKEKNLSLFSSCQWKFSSKIHIIILENMTVS